MTRALLNHSRAILLCAYAALCLAVLNATPLWLDEVLQLGVAWQRSLRELLPWIEVNPGAVPLPYIVQQGSLAVFGHSAFAARLPAAIFSILAGWAFMALCDRIGIRFRFLALALFLFFPLQFRYALEARGYSQGVFFTVATLWIFLALRETASLSLAALYFATIAVGMYFHPFLLFPVAAQVVSTTDRRIWISAALAGLCFAPWEILQHQARASYVFPALFPVGRVTPLTILHELTGGGYVSAAVLLFLTGFGLIRANMPAPAHRLLTVTAIFCIAGPLIGDLAFHYFFAGRQLLIAAPALVLLAAHGFENLCSRSRALAAALVAIFIGIAAVKDFQDATIPKDDLAASAEAVASRIDSDSCVITAPSWSIDYFVFFHPGVAFRHCADPVQSREVITVVAPGETPPHLPDSYALENVSSAGRSRLTVWRRQL